MPSRWPGLKCCVLTLIGVVFLIPPSAETQTNRGSVTLTGTVSESVALSVAPGLAAMDVVSSGNTVRLTLPGTDVDVRVPLMVRSNTSFKISANVETTTTQLAQLSVIDARATGRMASPQAVNELNVPQQFDRRRGGDNAPAMDLSVINVSQPFLLVSGPRVSLGGTLDSPQNALEITLLIRLKPQPVPGSPVHLTFVATAGPPTQ